MVSQYSQPRGPCDMGNYAKAIELYYKFAYFFCFVPYKFHLQSNGHRYLIHTWWGKQVLSYILNILHVFVVAKAVSSRIRSLHGSQERHGDPNLYLSFFERLSFMCYVLSSSYTMCFKRKEALHFINLVKSYSTKCNISNRSALLHKKWPSQILFSFMTFCSFVGCMNGQIAANFQISFGYSLSPGYENGDGESNMASATQLAIAVVNFIYGMNYYCWKIYTDLFQLTALYPMLLISLDFNQLAEEKLLEFPTLPPSKIMQPYKLIFGISNAHSASHGLALVFYFVSCLWYFSLFGEVIISSNFTGYKFYLLEYAFLFCVIGYLGSEFTYQMSLIGCIQKSKASGNKLNYPTHQSNGSAIINYHRQQRVYSAKAIYFSLSYSSLIKFGGSTLVFFLTTVDSRQKSIS